MKKLIIILLFPLIIKAQILSGIDTLQFAYNWNQNIDFELRSIMTDSTKNQYSFPCSLKIHKMDFFSYYNTSGSCICPCIPLCDAGSPMPFFKSKIDFYKLNLQNPLSIIDTALFIKIDTIKKYQNTNVCFLPFTEITLADSNFNNTIIVRSSTEKYVLIKIKPFINSIYCSDGPNSGWVRIVKGIIITWYLQNDGSLDFSGVDQTGIRKNSNAGGRNSIAHNPQRRFYIGFPDEHSHRNANAMFSIKGERLKIGNLGKTSGLLIYQ